MKDGNTSMNNGTEIETRNGIQSELQCPNSEDNLDEKSDGSGAIERKDERNGSLLSRMDVFGMTAGGRLNKAEKLISEGRKQTSKEVESARNCFQEAKKLLQSDKVESTGVREALGEVCLELGRIERFKGDCSLAVELLIEARTYVPLSQGDRDFIATRFAHSNRSDELAVSYYLETVVQWANQAKPNDLRPVFEILERLCAIHANLSEEEVANSLVFCILVSNADDEIPFPSFYRGVHFFLLKDYASASAEFKKAQDRQCAAPELGYYLNFAAGQNARQQRDLDGAADFFIEAVRRYPQLFAANYEAGVCLVQLAEAQATAIEDRSSGKTEPLETDASRRAFACSALERACRLDETSSDAWFYLGRAHSLDESWIEAGEAFEKAISLAPTPDFYLAHALVLDKQGKLSLSIEAAHKALALDPEYGDANRFIAKTSYQNGDLDASITEYRALIAREELAGKMEEATLSGLANCLYDRKRYSEVISLLESVKETIPSRIQLLLARSLSLEGDFKAAEDSYLRLATMEPEHGNHFYYLGTCRAHQKKYEEALEAFAQAEGCGDFPAQLPLQRGYVLETLGRFQEAQEAYRQIAPQQLASAAGEPAFDNGAPMRDNVEAKSNSISESSRKTASYRLGIMAMKEKRNEEAILWLEMSEPNLETLLALAQAQEMSGHLDVADEMYLRAISENPENLAPQVQFGCALARRKDWERAIPYLKEAIKKGDITEAAYYHLGMAYLHAEKYVNALSYLDKLPISAGLNETLCTLSLRAARQSREEGKYDLAIQYWQRAIRYGGSEVILKAEIGKAHLALGVRRALAGEPVFQWQTDIQKAEKYIPQEPNLQFALAVLDLCSARTKECLKRLESVQYVLEPHLQPCADYLTAMALLQQGDNEQAERIFSRLTALSQTQPLPFDPDYPHACLLAEQNKWEEAAKVLYSRIK